MHYFSSFNSTAKFLLLLYSEWGGVGKKNYFPAPIMLQIGRDNHASYQSLSCASWDNN